MKKRLTREQQSEIASLIGQNKVHLTLYIRSQFKDISDPDIEDCFQELFSESMKNILHLIVHPIKEVGFLRR